MNKLEKRFNVGDIVWVKPLVEGKVLAVGFFKCLVGYGKKQRWFFTSRLHHAPK